MKSRKEVEDSFKEIMVPAGAGYIKLSMELLLDIRELLSNMLSDQRMDRIKAERLEVKRKREQHSTLEEEY